MDDLESGLSQLLPTLDWCCMSRVLACQSDFQDEKPLIWRYVEECGHICTFLPKFHCKLKPAVEGDSSLIGGVRVTVGDEVLDTSVRARLASMQTALSA